MYIKRFCCCSCLFSFNSMCYMCAIADQPDAIFGRYVATVSNILYLVRQCILLVLVNQIFSKVLVVYCTKCISLLRK